MLFTYFNYSYLEIPGYLSTFSSTYVLLVVFASHSHVLASKKDLGRFREPREWCGKPLANK